MAIVRVQGSGLDETQSGLLSLTRQALEGSVERSHPSVGCSLFIAADNINNWLAQVGSDGHSVFASLVDESNLGLLLHITGPLDLGSVPAQPSHQQRAHERSRESEACSPLIVLAELSRYDLARPRGPSSRCTCGLVMSGKVLHQLLQRGSACGQNADQYPTDCEVLHTERNLLSVERTCTEKPNGAVSLTDETTTSRYCGGRAEPLWSTLTSSSAASSYDDQIWIGCANKRQPQMVRSSPSHLRSSSPFWLRPRHRRGL